MCLMYEIIFVTRYKQNVNALQVLYTVKVPPQEIISFSKAQHETIGHKSLKLPSRPPTLPPVSLPLRNQKFAVLVLLACNRAEELSACLFGLEQAQGSQGIDNSII